MNNLLFSKIIDEDIESCYFYIKETLEANGSRKLNERTIRKTGLYKGKALFQAFST